MAIPTPGSNVAAVAAHLRNSEGLSAADVQNVLSDATAIFGRCSSPNAAVNTSKGLIYGNIQSGKTAVILTLIALAADSGYERFVLLTSDPDASPLAAA